MEYMREIRTEEELLANICAAAEEIDIAKESANLVAIPCDAINKRFALNHYLGNDVDDERPSTIPAHPDSIVDEYNVTYHTNTGEGKGSLVEKLPGSDIDGVFCSSTDWKAIFDLCDAEEQKESYDYAMKVVK